jgi:hypothetical protein
VRVRNSATTHQAAFKIGILLLLWLASLASESPVGAADPTRPPGQREVMVPVALPSFMTTFSAAGPHGVQPLVIDQRHEGAFEIENSPPFVVADQSSPPLLKPGEPVSKAYRTLSSCVVYEGTGEPNGTGIDSSCNPLKKATQSNVAIQIIPDWPSKGSQLYVWAHLPASVKVVTYSFEGKDRAWVVPTNGSAALLVPRPAAFDANYGVWNMAPFPVLKAFDAKGRLISTEDAPRIGGDRVPTVRE